MGNCDKVKQHLADYRTGIVDAGTRRLVEGHISGCVDCAQELAVLDDVLEMVEHNVVALDPPAGLWMLYTTESRQRRSDRACR